eukprot:scaffold20591_cov132-Isochrysis_galbana.AAC.5
MHRHSTWERARRTWRFWRFSPGTGLGLRPPWFCARAVQKTTSPISSYPPTSLRAASWQLAYAYIHLRRADASQALLLAACEEQRGEASSVERARERACPSGSKRIQECVYSLRRSRGFPLSCEICSSLSLLLFGERDRESKTYFAVRLRCLGVW